MERNRQRVSPTFTLLSVLVFELGASMHLVGDSINHRLIHLGFQNHLKVKDNPIMKEVKPKELVSRFDVLRSQDENKLVLRKAGELEIVRIYDRQKERQTDRQRRRERETDRQIKEGRGVEVEGGKKFK